MGEGPNLGWGEAEERRREKPVGVAFVRVVEDTCLGQPVENRRLSGSVSGRAGNTANHRPVGFVRGAVTGRVRLLSHVASFLFGRWPRPL